MAYDGLDLRQFEFQPPGDLAIFDGAVSSLEGRPYNGADFNASMFEISVNTIPHLIESVPIDLADKEVRQNTVILLARYTHRRVLDGVARVNDYDPEITSAGIMARNKVEFGQAYGLVPSSPSVFVALIGRSITAYRSRVTSMEQQYNVTYWEMAANAALQTTDLEILATMEDPSEE